MLAAESTPLKKLAEDDRPRERAVKYGLSSLTDSELIAILLGSGSRNESVIQLARRIYASCGNDIHKFARVSINKLKDFRGVGEAKAVTLAAALELGRRRMRTERIAEPQITRSSDVYDLIAPYIVDKAHEEVWLVMMNQAGRVINHSRISLGGMTGTIVDPKIIMRLSIENHATRIILVHNHPSGSARPSQQDIDLTQKIKHGGQLLDIKLTDHVIVAGDRYYSFLDEGML
jgi:DNA repair protein RadC